MFKGDVDIDVGNRDFVIKELQKSFKIVYATQSIQNQNEIIPHNVGVYFNNIPKDIFSNYSLIDYKKADDLGYTKIDLLHNTIYDNFKNRSEIKKYLNIIPDWNMLNNEDLVNKLPHIASYYRLLQSLPKIDSIEKLAMFIAIIRPAKKRYIEVVKQNNNWDCIKNNIWIKEPEDEDLYRFKKSHSIGYAQMIVLYMNYLKHKP